MFEFFKKKTDPPTRHTPPPPASCSTKSPTPATKPPPIPTQGKALPPKLPREHHHEMTHEFLPDWFMGKDRGKFITLLTNKNLQVYVRAGWDAVGQEFGNNAVPSQTLEVTGFRKESYLCGLFEFPRPTAVGEAFLGLVVAGPVTALTAEVFASMAARYFILEAAPNHTSVVKEWSRAGFADVCPGPSPGTPITVFMDLCFEQMFGKKRPTAEEAARRLCVLKHLVIYAQATTFGKKIHELPDLSQAAKADLHSVMGGIFSQTLRQEDLWESVSTIERQFFDTPVQNLTSQQVINASWRAEALHMLMWALGLIPELPSWDHRAGLEITKLVPGGNVEDFIKSARLRDEKEIDNARKIAELWNWRSRTRQLIQQGYPFQPNEPFQKGRHQQLGGCYSHDRAADRQIR